MEKMWAGRFVGALDKEADDFNSSISFDSKMYREDIRGSMAHAAMLATQNIISGEDFDAIIKGLEGILDDLDSGMLMFNLDCEDIHMLVEAELTERTGEAGKRLQTARRIWKKKGWISMWTEKKFALKIPLLVVIMELRLQWRLLF